MVPGRHLSTDDLAINPFIYARGHLRASCSPYHVMEADCLPTNVSSRHVIPARRFQGDWNLLYTSKSKFDPRNPLGSRVDGTAPGIEGFFTALFGVRMSRGDRGSTAVVPLPFAADSPDSALPAPT